MLWKTVINADLYRRCSLFVFILKYRNIYSCWYVLKLSSFLNTELHWYVLSLKSYFSFSTNKNQEHHSEHLHSHRTGKVNKPHCGDEFCIVWLYPLTVLRVGNSRDEWLLITRYRQSVAKSGCSCQEKAEAVFLGGRMVAVLCVSLGLQCVACSYANMC